LVAVAKRQWRDILCLQDERSVASDNTVVWNGRRLQIPAHPSRPHFVPMKVKVHHYPDGALAIFHGPLCVARWSAGEPNTPEPKRKPLAPGPGEADRDDLSTMIHSPKSTRKAVNPFAT
jgi:hypothetical protein